MQLLLRLLSLGILPAVWLSGHFVLTRLARHARLPLPTVSAWSLAPAIGFPAWSLVLAMAAYWRVCHIAFWGALAWIACVPLGIHAWRHRRLGCRQSAGKNIVLGLIMAVSFGMYAGFPHDSFFVGRDQATYANQAVHIAHTGDLELDWPVPIEDARLRNTIGRASYSATGIYMKSDRLQVQFAPVLPVWLAVAFSALGIIGLQGFNAVVATLAAGVFFGLASRLMSRWLALAATAIFALNPMQIWISRITLSEIVTQHLVLSSLLLMLSARRRSGEMTWLWGGITLGASVLVRIDGFVLAPLVVAFAWLSRALALPPHPRAQRAQTLGMLGVLGVLALGVPFYLLTAETYTFAQGKKLLPIAAATVLLLPVWWARLGAGVLGALLRRRWFWVAVGVVLAALAAFAYFIRPIWEPFSYYAKPNAVRYGLRNYREDSFVNLGVYVTPLLSFGAVAGFYGLLRRGFAGRVSPAVLLLCVVWAGYSLLYLYNPSISPDQPWGMRRFVPVVIPGAVLLAASLLNQGRGVPLLSRWHAPLGALLALAVLGYTNFRCRAALFLREYDGAYEFVSSVADAIPPGALVLSDASPRIFGHLALARGLQAIKFSFRDQERFDAAQTVLASRANPDEPYYVVTDRPQRMGGAKPIRSFEATFRWLDETTTAPAQSVRKANFRLHLYERRGPLLEPWKYLNDLGMVPIPGVREAGFWPVEGESAERSRWTKAEARLDVPITKGWTPRSLELEIVGIPPAGTWLTVRANGSDIFNDLIEKAPASLALTLPPKVRNRLKLELVSDTFRPSDTGTSDDERELGVRLKALKLR